MTTTRNFTQGWPTWLLGLCAMLPAVGCRFDSSGVAPAGFLVYCDAEVWDCPKTTTAPNFTLSGSNANISSYLKRHDFWGVKNAAYQAYWNRPIFVINPGPDALRGSTLVMTGATEWNVNDPTFMTVTLNEEVAGIYVAYDSRANPKPSWLLDTSKYQKLTKPVVVTITDHTKSPPEHLGLDVYLAKNVTANGATLSLPGNSHGGPGWQAVTVGDPAMYLVFVAPKPQPNCAIGKYKKPYHLDDCYTAGSDEEAQALAAAVTAATAGCESANPNDVCKTPVCTTAGWEPICESNGGVTGCTFCRVIDGGFEHNSEVVFLPASCSASGTVAGSSFNSAISGQLLFEYVTDALGAMDVMRINRMGLNVESFGTELGEFTEVKVALRAMTAAKCQDSPAPVATPCGWYQIPTGEFWCLESCRVDGDPVAFSSNSDAPIDIYLDPVTHTFSITGHLQSTATVDGEEFEIDITLDLTGEVVNYAPNAAAGFEGDDVAECLDQANESAIYLYAGGSFDVDDGALPGSSFNWYEDYGLVTETYWGSGETVTIGASQLGYGEHSVTLVVTDSQGVLATDTITVSVADTTPPDLVVPDDVEVFTTAPLPILVSIGEASASDVCLPLVDDAISNDAPADSRFGAGETTVTWSADDGRGNVATETQSVLVNSVSGPTSLIDAIRQGIVQLQEAIDQSQADISQCSPAEECPVDLGALVVMIEELIGTTHEAAEQGDEGTDAYAPLLESLEVARMHIVEASAALEESNAVGEADPALMMREQAIDHLMAAGEALDDSAQQVESLEGEPGPIDGDEPADDGEGVDQGADDGAAPRGATRRTGFCGFGAGMILACLPLLAIWKLRRKF
ncbi:MAG: hypothetical protein JSV19_11995 [Phycisphaerales bacterium]|nr:MAG: hypothetical protein JSV19_11995 [Phycisphaerales bacterium]